MRRRAHRVSYLVRVLSGVVLLAALMVLAGCQPDPLVSPYPGTPTAAQLQILREMEARMAEVRGLEPLREVEYAFVSRGSMNRVLDDYARRTSGYDFEELSTPFETQPVYELLGFIPPGADLGEMRARLFASAAAFYDPGWYTVVLVGDRLTLDMSTEVILAHEFVHALQDQHFGLYEVNKLTARNEGGGDISWDASFAFNALIEGDATVVMRQYVPMSLDFRDPWATRYMEGAEGIERRFPDVLQTEFAFPYEAGVGFIEALLANGGWEAVNDAYGRPPTTTEQILHPEKYLAGEVGETGDVGEDIIFGIVSGSVVKPLRGPWWLNSYGRLGEFLLRTHLEEELPETEAASAAAGWGGDHWTLYFDDEKGNLLHLVINWDAPQELDEFYEAYLKWLDVASEGTSQVLGADAALWHGEERSVYVCRRDGRATILIASERGLLDEARRNLGLP